MGKIASVRDLDVAGRRVLLRMDLNVPLKGGGITDDTRIRAALPTIRHLLEAGASVVGCSHMGRPKGRVVSELSLAPVAERLRRLLPGVDVRLAGDSAGPDAAARAGALRPGMLLLLENVRFEPGETRGDEELADRMRPLADVYVNDAFGAAHRSHASVDALARKFPERAMGLLMEREWLYLKAKLEAPERPYTAILGGAKVSDKIPILDNLVEKVDHLCIGGAMAYTFLTVRGISVGASLVEPDQRGAAEAILGRAAERGVTVDLPADHVVAPSPDRPSEARCVSGGIPEDLAGLDIGPSTAERFGHRIRGSRTVLWNGPMGVFETPAFAEGTLAVARAVADSRALSIVGGGDSVAALQESGLADRITHLSTGGGACLELLAGLDLPGFAALEM